MRSLALLAALLASGCGLLFPGKADAGADPCADNPTLGYAAMPSEVRLKPGQSVSIFWELRTTRGTALAVASVNGAQVAGPAVSGYAEVTAPPLPGTYTLDVARVDCPGDVGHPATLLVEPLPDLGPAPGVQPVPTGVAWSPDGTKVAVSGNGGVWLFSSTGAFLESRKLPHQKRPSVTFSPDGAVLAVGGDLDAPTWLLRAEGLVPQGTAGGAGSRGGVYSEDGRELYLLQGGALRVVTTATGATRQLSPLSAVTRETESLPRVKRAPLGAVLVTVPGELRERATGRRMSRWAQGTALDGVVLAPDATLVLTSSPGGGMLSYPFFPQPLSGGGTFSSADILPDGTAALGGTGSVSVVRLRDGVLTPLGGTELPNDTAGKVLDVAWSPDGSRLAVAGARKLHLFTRAELGL